MKKCPVCASALSDPLPPFCPQHHCGWDVSRDLTLNPSLAIPDYVLTDYGEKLAIARKKWSEWLDTGRSQEELAEKLLKARRDLAGEREKRIKEAGKAGRIILSVESRVEQVAFSSRYSEDSLEGNQILIERGNRLAITYRMLNELDMEFPVWLGANLQAGGQYYFNSHEDREVALTHGESIFERHLTVNKNWPPGEYQMVAEVWYGPCSQWQNSVPLATLWEKPIPVIVS